MFTGIVETVGRVAEVTPAGQAVRLVISAPELFADVALGESIAVNGVCLTVAGISPRGVRFDVVPETVQRTDLRELRPGDRVNLERALRPGDRLGGHFVQGHVDAVGTVRSIERAGAAYLLRVQAPPAVTDYLVEKGSVAIDGVSLTVVDVDAEGFSVALIPHTLATTTLGQRQPGDRVNLEADILGKYVARQLRLRTAARPPAEEPLLRLLQEEGYTS